MSIDPNHDPASPLGWDVDVETDMQPDGRACSGGRLVGNAMLHRLMEDTLPCIGAPGNVLVYGEDVRKWVGEVTTPAQAARKGPLLAAVLTRDDRVDPVTLRIQVLVAPSLTFADKSAVDLAIVIQGQTTTALPIALVIGISKVTVELLAQGT